jgi:hypothetical protein
MPPPEPELDFDGSYRVERLADQWFLRGPALCRHGSPGMFIGEAGSLAVDPMLLAKYRDLADLFNQVVAAERERAGRDR